MNRSVLLLLMLAGLIACSRQSEPRQAPPVAKQLLRAAEQPDFELFHLNGSPLRFSDLRTPVTVVGLWASWCVPCLLEMPYLQALNEQTQPLADVRVLLLNVDEASSAKERDLLRDEARHWGTTMPLLADPQGKLWSAIGQDLSLPQVVIIDSRFKLARLRGFPMGATRQAYVQTYLALIELARQNKLDQPTADALGIPCSSTGRAAQPAEPDQAIQVLLAGLKEKPRDMAKLLALASLYERSGRFKKALATWRQIAELNPTLAQALDGQARSLMKGGHDLPEAEQLSLRSLQLDPDNGRFLQTMGRIMAAKGEMDKAVGFYRQSLGARPGDVALVLELGSVLGRLGRTDQAIQLYRNSLEFLGKRLQPTN